MTITLDYRDDAELARKCQSILDTIGHKPERITVGELARRLGRHTTTVSVSLRRRRRRSCPEFRHALGKKRILWLEPTRELLEYLKPQPQKARA